MYTPYTEEEDDDPATLLQYMRPEEDLREHRRRIPWRGEHRLFRAANVVKLEDHHSPGDMGRALERLQQHKRDQAKTAVIKT
jgi:hypothetical protein